MKFAEVGNRFNSAFTHRLNARNFGFGLLRIFIFFLQKKEEEYKRLLSGLFDVSRRRYVQ